MSPDYLTEMVWHTKDGRECVLKDMTRVHVQNSLNWCIRNKPAPFVMMSRSGYDIEFDIKKDSYTYDEWILAFTVRLFDPACV